MESHIGYIAEEIEDRLNRSGKEIPRENRCHSDEWYEKYPEDKFYPIYTKEAQQKLREAVKALRVAYVYAHRVDRFFARDDGEEFMEKIDKELKEL
ncbi:MAG: hypothetical protein PHI90_09575 [Clostridia bacterium]|nr:hypothetical protein [Clostridia bacterium]